MERNDLQERLEECESLLTRRYNDEENNATTTEFKVYDSSLDNNGKLADRASTGTWKASPFIFAIEFSERLSHFGIATNLIIYLTKVMHQDLKTAANNVNVWNGVTTVLPLLSGFLTDAYIGRYFMILISAVLYVVALGIFTMSQFIPSLKPCGTTSSLCQNVSEVHKAVFFSGAYLMALAVGGFKPCLQSFGVDQFDDNHAVEREQKMSFFNGWTIVVCSGLFFGVTVIVFVEDYISWGAGFSILAIMMGVSVLIYVLGSPFYRYKNTQGSPLTPLLQVLVAATTKRDLVLPSDVSVLYEATDSGKLHEQFLGHTERLRFLDKAAIIESHESNRTILDNQSQWRLATVTQVEELKLIINMMPIWLTFLVFGIGIAKGNTFFIKQSNVMDRKIFEHFEIPAAFLASLNAIGMITSIFEGFARNIGVARGAKWKLNKDEKI